MKVFLFPPNGPKIELDRRAALSYLGVASTTLSQWCKGKNRPRGRWAGWAFTTDQPPPPAKRKIPPSQVRYVICDLFGWRAYYASTVDLARTHQVTNDSVRRWVRDRALTPEGAWVIEVHASQRTFHWYEGCPYGDLADVDTPLAPATVRRRATAERIPAVVRREWAPRVKK